MRTALSVVALSLFAAAALSACAPRMAKTHYARWEEQDQKRREENAAEEKVEAWMRAQAGVAPADGKTGTTQAPASTPRLHQETTQPANRETPPITATSTRSSRVIKPSEQPADGDDEAIY